MSSDKKAKELMTIASFKEGFREDIKEFRKKYGIPEDGFFSYEQSMKWRRNLFVGPKSFLLYINKKISKKPLDFAKDCDLILKKYKLPATLYPLLRDYIFFNDEIASKVNSALFTCSLELPKSLSSRTSNERRWNQAGVNYAKLLISEFASKNEVKKYIDKKWNMIRQMMTGKEKDNQAKRIRISINLKRDKEIYELYSKSRKELGLKRGEYKDMYVKKLLKFKYKNLTEENVRAVVSRFRKKLKTT